MKKNLLFLTLLLAVLLLGAISAEAANRYVRADATGANNGGDWTNAYTTLPAALTRGDTYYVAGGTYGSITLNTAVSGTTTVTIKKATIADHGTSTGWNDTFASTRADFGSITAITDYWVFDGQSRNESNWNDGASYGLHFSAIRASKLEQSAASSHMVFRYVDVGGTDGAVCTYVPVETCGVEVETRESFYIGGFSSTNPASDWTISRFRVHNVILPFQLPGSDNIVIEYGWIGPNWQKEAIRGGNNNRTSNVTIRYNKFIDSCKGRPNDPSGSNRCTGTIAIWSANNAGDLDNNAIYGNLILETTNYPGDPAAGILHTDACISIGGNGGTWAGVVTNHSRIYNNTIVGVRGGGSSRCVIGTGGAGTDNETKNNLWYSVTAETTCDSGSGCASNSVVSSGSQFINPVTAYPGTGFNYSLASALAGTTLTSPYNVDLDGHTRGADGVWDRGAIELVVGGDTAPPIAPQNLRVQ